MQEQTPIKLTPDQEKAYKARMNYIEKHSVKNPNNPKYEMVILEKDGSLTLTGGSETSAEQRLKIIADKVREARALITQQYEVNKNEQSDRNL